jgi:hypothetical protein
MWVIVFSSSLSQARIAADCCGVSSGAKIGIVPVEKVATRKYG